MEISTSYLIILLQPDMIFFLQFTFDLLDQYSLMRTVHPILVIQIQEITIKVFTESSNHSMVYFDMSLLYVHICLQTK